MYLYNQHWGLWTKVPLQCCILIHVSYAICSKTTDSANCESTKSIGGRSSVWGKLWEQRISAECNHNMVQRKAATSTNKSKSQRELLHQISSTWNFAPCLFIFFLFVWCRTKKCICIVPCGRCNHFLGTFTRNFSFQYSPNQKLTKLILLFVFCCMLHRTRRWIIQLHQSWVSCHRPKMMANP